MRRHPPTPPPRHRPRPPHRHRSNVHVAIVTAAGYPGAPERFEQRVEGLLAAFRQLGLPRAITDRFHIMGGECNYLLRVAGPGLRLEFVPDAEWKSELMQSWTQADCERLLDAAERLLLEGAHRLRLPVQVIRKERAVGVVPTQATIYEVLEDLAITVQVGGGAWVGWMHGWWRSAGGGAIRSSRCPAAPRQLTSRPPLRAPVRAEPVAERPALLRLQRRQRRVCGCGQQEPGTGGADEPPGLHALRGQRARRRGEQGGQWAAAARTVAAGKSSPRSRTPLPHPAHLPHHALPLLPPQVLHVGDRFSDTGNDSATRDCCSILWVANPEETGARVGWWQPERVAGMAGWGGAAVQRALLRRCGATATHLAHLHPAHSPDPTDFFIKLLLNDLI